MSAEADVVTALNRDGLRSMAPVLIMQSGVKLLGLTGLGLSVIGMAAFQPSGDIVQRFADPYVLAGLIAFIFHLGMTWRDVLYLKKRVEKLENRLDNAKLSVVRHRAGNDEDAA